MAARKQRRRWVRKVEETSDAKFQSAMSMLNLYVNRAGRALTGSDRRRLEAAKRELRRAFGRPPDPRKKRAA